jgi:hypothetical protein
MSGTLLPDVGASALIATAVVLLHLSFFFSMSRLLDYLLNFSLPALGRQLGISRGPVRHAFLLLFLYFSHVIQG